MTGTPGTPPLGPETKLCPYCAEEIRSSAIKCKHCGTMLGTSHQPVPAPPPAPYGPNHELLKQQAADQVIRDNPGACICTSCGRYGRSRKYTKGPGCLFQLALVLIFIFGLVNFWNPLGWGLLFASFVGLLIEQASTRRFRGCGSCGSQAVVPLGSPGGRQHLMAGLQPRLPP